MRRYQHENEGEYETNRGGRGQQGEGNRQYGAAGTNRGDQDRNWERNFGGHGGGGGYEGGDSYQGGGRYEGERYYGRPSSQSDYERQQWGGGQQGGGQQWGGQQWGGQQGGYGGGGGYGGDSGRMSMGGQGRQETGGMGGYGGYGGYGGRTGGQGQQDLGGVGQQRQNRQFKPPRGFARNDERIREEIVEKLMRNDIDASEVEIQVKEGEVTLTGTVTDRQDKRLIEDLTEDVLGVKDVNNQIRRAQKQEDTPQKGGNGAQERSTQRTGRTQGVHG